MVTAAETRFGEVLALAREEGRAVGAFTCYGLLGSRPNSAARLLRSISRASATVSWSRWWRRSSPPLAG